jgi:16S rRNA processing protein RimM
MISKDISILLGTLTKPHGTKGSLLLRIRDLKAEEFKDKGSVFVEIDGLLVPFFLEEYSIKSSDSAVIRLQGVLSETKAREFAGHQVYINQNQVKRNPGKSGVPTGIRNYTVTDRKLGFIGLATGIIEVANNPQLIVQAGDKEYLVPAHENIILEINDKEKAIRIDAPDGLFEI